MKVLRPSKTWLVKIALFAFAAVLVSFGTGAAYGDTPQPQNLNVLAIGLTYDKDKGAQAQTPLPCCEKDAVDMARWAKNQKGKLAGNVDARPMIDTKATGNDIVSALRDLKNRAGASDHNVVYMSGHGGKGRSGEYEFCAHDRNVKWSEIREALQGIKGTTIVILDACQSGAVSDNGDLIVFSAALANQSSVGYRDAKMNSLFTRLLLEGLNGKADMNGDGRISLAELDAYVSGQLELLGQHDAESTMLRPANVPSSLPLAKLTAGTTATVNAETKDAKLPTLAGTTWEGKESPTKGNFGRLTFRFGADGKATMIDAQSTAEGTYTQAGNQVTITLPGVAVYEGMVTGNTMTGTGTCDSLGNWPFNVAK